MAINGIKSTKILFIAITSWTTHHPTKLGLIVSGQENTKSWTFTSAIYCWYMMVKQDKGVGGMQAVTGMQVTGLMLNRCDSMQERQTQSSLMLDGKYNQRESRSWILPSEAFCFLASHDDSAKTLVLNSISEQMEAIAHMLLCESFAENRSCAQTFYRVKLAALSIFLCVQLIFTWHLCIEPHRGVWGTVNFTAQ